jgi:hypothetical protein
VAVVYAAVELAGIGGDAFFVVLTAGFFALCTLLVKACEHVMGPDPTDLVEGGTSLAEDAAAVTEAEPARTQVVEAVR